jgi:hypothetical protein
MPHARQACSGLVSAGETGLGYGDAWVSTESGGIRLRPRGGRASPRLREALSWLHAMRARVPGPGVQHPTIRTCTVESEAHNDVLRSPIV